MRTRTIKALEEALHEDETRRIPGRTIVTKQLYLAFIDVRGYDNFWDLAAKLRWRLLVWMVENRTSILAWKRDIIKAQPLYFSRSHLSRRTQNRLRGEYMCLQLLQVVRVPGRVSRPRAVQIHYRLPEIETLSPAYFHTLPGSQMRRFQEELAVLVRNKILPVAPTVLLQPHPHPADLKIARILGEIEVLQRTCLSQMRLIQGLKEELSALSCPERRSEMVHEERQDKKTDSSEGKRGSGKTNIIKLPRICPQAIHSAKDLVFPESCQKIPSQTQRRLEASISTVSRPIGSNILISHYEWSTFLTIMRNLACWCQIDGGEIVDRSRDSIQRKFIGLPIHSNTSASNRTVPPATDYGGSFVTSSMFEEAVQKTRAAIDTVPPSPPKTRRPRTSMTKVTDDMLPARYSPRTHPNRPWRSIENKDSESSDSTDDTSSFVVETEIESESDEDCSDGSRVSNRSDSLFVE